MPSFAMGSWLQKWRFCRNPSPPKGWRSKFAKCWIARPEAEEGNSAVLETVGMERETGFEPRSLAGSALIPASPAPARGPAPSRARVASRHPTKGAHPLRNPGSRVQLESTGGDYGAGNGI